MSPRKEGHDLSTSLTVAGNCSSDALDTSGQLTSEHREDGIVEPMDVEDANEMDEGDRLLRCVKNFFIVC